MGVQHPCWACQGVLGTSGGWFMLLLSFTEAWAQGPGIGLLSVTCSQGTFVGELGQPVSEVWEA